MRSKCVLFRCFCDRTLPLWYRAGRLRALDSVAALVVAVVQSLRQQEAG